MNNTLRKSAYIASFFSGAMLIYIGTLFFLTPAAAEAGYGVHTGQHSVFAFHYIKGIRDFASGLLMLVLLLNKEFRALGWLMICMGIIPVTDFLIVLNDAHQFTNALYAHAIAVILCFLLGAYYLFTIKKPVNAF
ncbi:uncharacterized protein DUF4267 [Chitinophaga polysaccharea]|uniref:Uncharacterized protein DUF4267 n=1 Tax=Chitinophaga polysaccharea TaxID=1293035 RepID=A0A561P9S7_9BACT|nr:DUF4267 domain-containing protein [Chitinophaga polysaccharea]TWF34902.1 uncharacterized protein DUF4267 [Chitinophaga polysaccharea]